MKKALSIIAGLATAFFTIASIGQLSGNLYPLPEGASIETLREWVASLPPGAFLVTLFAWISGSFDGTFIKELIDPSGKGWDSMLVSGIVLATAIYNLINIPHPWYIWAGAILGIIPAGIGALILAKGLASKEQ